jgi:transcriptional regulator GlxA family with amidase domain
MTSAAHHVGMLVFPDVTLLDVAGPAEVFTVANGLTDSPSSSSTVDSSQAPLHSHSPCW